jgi:propanol-preferring alcohol dehydrogenase
MRATILTQTGAPLEPADLPCPSPGPSEILIHVSAAGCKTDLQVVDGELASPKPRLVPGHEIVGRVTAAGSKATRFKIGDCVGVPWLGWACGSCEFCRHGQEDLCESARFTGYQPGYAERTAAWRISTRATV